MPLSRTRPLVALAAATLLLTGCDQLPPLPGTAPPIVAMDLDAVARAIGRDQYMKERLESATSDLQNRIKEGAEKLQAELTAERDRLGTRSTEEDRRKLQAAVAQAQQQVQQARANASAQVQQLRQRLVLQFRTEVRPHAASVARKQGALVVVPAGSMHWHDPRIDITAAVIDALRTAGVGDRPPESADTETAPATQ